VVGIGASAGGLEALVEVLRHLPSETGMAFVVAPPSDPQQKSNLVESLSRLTGTPVTEAADGLRLEPNHVYILPAATGVAVFHGVLNLMPRPETHARHQPIDALPHSLAEDKGDQAIGGILSGSELATEEALWFANRVLEIANRHSEMAPLLAEFVAEIKRFCQCTAVGFRILDDDGGIPYQACEGFSRGFYEAESPLSIKRDKCMCINVIKGATDPNLPFYTKGGSFYMNGTTHFLATVSPEQKGRTRNRCNEEGYESVALVPIRVGGHTLGLIHVADPRENAVPVKTVETLERAAMQLGTAIRRVGLETEVRQAKEELEDRVRQRTAELAGTVAQLEAAVRERARLEEEVLEVGEMERCRLGEDLHDGLGQGIAGAAFMGQLLHQKLSEQSLPEAAEAAKITGHLRGCLELTRSLARGLCPIGLGPKGLPGALRELASQLESTYGVACAFGGDRRASVADNAVATHLYRLAQESAGNAAKHAKASRIRIELSKRGGCLVLSVRDNGVGLPEGYETKGGLGLHIMRLRARAIGASLSVEQCPEGGTAVTVRLPKTWKREWRRRSNAGRSSQGKDEGPGR